MIRNKIDTVLNHIAELCTESNRSSQNVVTVLVTKTVPVERIYEAYECGMRDFGENKVQELLSKRERLPADINWHFIGHLQRNKVKYVIDKVCCIHSLDSVRLAREISKNAVRCAIEMPCLIQVNTSREETKFGIEPRQADEMIQAAETLPGLVPKGFMTMAPFTDDPDLIRESFRRLRLIRDTIQEKYPELDLSQLSMGMSADYHIAVPEGATIVRIGSVIFGERDY